MKNNYKTTETFVSADGRTTGYQDIFEAIHKFAEMQVKRGWSQVADSEDFMQEAFFKALKSAAHYDSRQSLPKTYGNTIARNCCIDLWKAGERFGEPLSSYEREDEDGRMYYSSEVSNWGVGENDVERIVEGEETMSTIIDCIDSLPETDRIIIWSTAAGDKPKEIAKVLGMTPGAVSTRLHRARKVLAVMLSDVLSEYGMCA